MLFVFVQDVVCNAARELVDSIGAHDPLTSSQYLALYQVTKLVEAGYFTPRLQMQWKKPFHVITSSQLRAVSCYVDKVIKNWIAVFSSGFTRSLLHINSRLSDRDLSTKSSGSIQAEVLERCINSTGFFHPFLDFFATSSVAAFIFEHKFLSFLFLDLQMTCACRLFTD